MLVSVAGCASIDYDYPREESYFDPDTADTRLGQNIAPLVATKPPGQSGFYPMEDGVILLAERAEKTIDVQYYLIKNDIVGRAFILSLLRAADQGVRVRLLLDDMFTKGYDVGIAALYSHPNFDIRIFNPFRRGAAGRTLGHSRSTTRSRSSVAGISPTSTSVSGRMPSSATWMSSGSALSSRRFRICSIPTGTTRLRCRYRPS
jgi:putative cardiolipin synthase